MINQQDIELYKLKARLCRTFADPTRLMIINQLRSGEKTVSQIQLALGLVQPIISRHLALLRERGVVKAQRKGTNMIYSLSDPKIIAACDMVHNILLNQIAKDKDMAERLITASM
ncbi:MAG: metalloregulator ArsR/SmtB family transcription factor [Dehalococcoidales bacterium]|nr:metalloregulator ArsR/SmtB family transcription factor [Dehalococcoidales bacterium]